MIAQEIDLLVYRSQDSLLRLLEALGLVWVHSLPNLDGRRCRLGVREGDKPFTIPAISNPDAVTYQDVAGKIVCGDVPLWLAPDAKLVLVAQPYGDPAGRLRIGGYRVHRCGTDSPRPVQLLESTHHG